MSMAHTEVTQRTTIQPTSVYTSPVEDLASFLIVRGPYAWLGAGWSGWYVNAMSFLLGIVY